MANFHELIVSARDAEVLALMLRERRRGPEAADALADLLREARLVPHEELPADRIAMNSKVTYRVEPQGERRCVILVHPRESDASAGRISVLSPVGRAFLGRTPGSVVTVAAPGREVSIRILEAARKGELRAA